MGHHDQLSLHSCITHMFVNCKVTIYSRYIAISFCFYLTYRRR